MTPVLKDYKSLTVYNDNRLAWIIKLSSHQGQCVPTAPWRAGQHMALWLLPQRHSRLPPEVIPACGHQTLQPLPQSVGHSKSTAWPLDFFTPVHILTPIRIYLQPCSADIYNYHFSATIPHSNNTSYLHTSVLKLHIMCIFLYLYSHFLCLYVPILGRAIVTKPNPHPGINKVLQ